ncbi:MAG: hypothetical protein SPL62_10080 [Selenomonas sp.]|jgi:hypothetical protein|nr:hypothetical protein [Selenomonas sp.]
MKKWVLAVLFAAVCLFVPQLASASEVSSDSMLMEFEAQKVWMDKGNLCVRGTFYNKQDDITITKLNDMELHILLQKKDGTEASVSKKPVKLPMLRIGGGGSKTVTLNLGPYDGNWDTWMVDSDCVFTYISGASW